MERCAPPAASRLLRCAQPLLSAATPRMKGLFGTTAVRSSVSFPPSTLSRGREKFPQTACGRGAAQHVYAARAPAVLGGHDHGLLLGVIVEHLGAVLLAIPTVLRAAEGQ